MEPTFRTMTTTMVPAMQGMVTWVSCFQRPAPSICAASYSSGLMPPIAAMKMIEFQPADYHISEAMTQNRNQFLSPRK